MINVYLGMKLTPEQEKEMYEESFKYIRKKLDKLFTNDEVFSDFYDAHEEIGDALEDAGERVNQMCNYIDNGHWD